MQTGEPTDQFTQVNIREDQKFDMDFPLNSVSLDTSWHSSLDTNAPNSVIPDDQDTQGLDEFAASMGVDMGSFLMAEVEVCSLLIHN
jgi:hypothetical protein